MHTAKNAYETIELLWNNYRELCKKVDLDSMSDETFNVHRENKSPVRSFRIATWLARQGYFISAWSLWEYYSRNLCQSLPDKIKKRGDESNVEWIARSLIANKKTFKDHKWFSSANCVRNIIAHSGGRVDGAKAQAVLKRSRTAFADIETLPDGYLFFTHAHVAELHCRIEDYIRETA